jgi:hypothetical protein
MPNGIPLTFANDPSLQMGDGWLLLPKQWLLSDAIDIDSLGDGTRQCLSSSIQIRPPENFFGTRSLLMNLAPWVIEGLRLESSS